jgi:endonuclease/exonuclease/phosphatase family metal-dependent hydrolase
MKLVQLNAWGGRLEPQIRNFLKAEAPDIVCMQEVISLQATGSGFFLPIEGMQAATDLPYMAFAPALSFKFMRGVAEFGNAILSKQPIDRSEIVFTHDKHAPDFVWGEKIANMRNFVHAVILINDKPCHVITHHGYWISEHKNGNEETIKQMSQIVDYISDLEGPVILTGDFNLSPHSESLEKINAVLENLSLKYDLKTTRTNLTHKTEVCDYVFVNDQVGVKNFGTSDEVISDHRALIMEFEV